MKYTKQIPFAMSLILVWKIIFSSFRRLNNICSWYIIVKIEKAVGSVIYAMFVELQCDLKISECDEIQMFVCVCVCVCIYIYI